MIHAVVFVLAQQRATLTVGDRTELRSRVVEATTGSGLRPVFDLYTAPNAVLNLNDRRFAHSLAYSPRLTLRGDALPGENPELLQTGALQSSWRSRRVSISLGESAIYGLRNFGDLSTPTTTTLSAPPPGGQIVSAGRPLVPLQRLPTTRSISFGASTTTLSSIVIPERRWSIATRASFSLFGGTDADAQVFLPLQRGGAFDAAVSHTLSRSDQIVTTVAPSAIYIPKAICDVQPLPTVPPSAPITCNRAVQFLDVSEGWTKRWSRYTTTNLVAGVTARRVRLDLGSPFRTTLAPLGGLDVTHRFGRTLIGTNSRVGTVVDQRTGLAETRMSHGLNADWKHYAQALHSTVQYSQTLGGLDINRLRLVYVEATATRRLSSRFDADGGVRVTWQENLGDAIVLTNFFLGIVYHEPRMLF